MAVGLSVTAQSLLKQTGIQPQIVLELEGLDLIYAAQPVFKTLNWDDVENDSARWDSSLFWDGSIEDFRALDYISLNGTTTNISQQIRPDKGSTSSVSTVNIAILDVDGKVSKQLSFDSITEILGRKATFSIGFFNEAAVYPQDYQAIFRGIVVDFYTENGIVMVSLASPETLKRQVMLEKFQSETTLAIDNSVTTIPVVDTIGMYPTQDAITTYIRIDDELMQVVSFTDTSIEVIRAQLNTVANAHDDEIEFETFYRMQGKPLDLARKIMLSDEGNTYFESLDTPKSINFISITESLNNALIFDYFDIKEKTGLVVGDFIKLDSTSNTGTFTIKEFGQLETGDSFIIVNEILVTENDYVDTFLYKSQWNVLATGLGMLTSEVDVDEFNSIAAAFSSNFVDYDLYIKDSIDDTKTFLDSVIMFPQGLFSLPRKARSSVKYITPPFSSDIAPALDSSAITNLTKIKQRRSIHKYLYSSYVWRYNQDSLEDKHLSGKIVVSTASLNRIKAGKKQLKIDASGLRNNTETTSLIENISQRMIDKYSLAPVYIEGIETSFKAAYGTEVGDIVVAFGEDTKMIDLKTGLFQKEKLYEVTNKSLNLKTGRIKLSLLSSAFEIESRYVVVGPSSLVKADSTADRLLIEPVAGLGVFANPTAQWLDFNGNRITVRSDDYTESATVSFNVDPTNTSALILLETLPFTPQAGYIVEYPEYENSDASIDSDYKLQFGYAVSEQTITVSIDNKSFEVDKPNDLAVDSLIYIHSEDFTVSSFAVLNRIVSIVGSVVTMEDVFEFIPQVGYKLERSNFLDSDVAYPYVLI